MELAVADNEDPTVVEATMVRNAVAIVHTLVVISETVREDDVNENKVFP
jgi:hypothetical protein